MSLLETYQLAFDVSPVPMILVGMDGKILLANDPFSQLFEYEPGALIGVSVDVLVPQQARAQHGSLRAAFGTSPSKRSMGAGRDLSGVTQSGKDVPLELGLEPVRDGAEQMVLVTAIDISHRKIHENLTRQAMDAAASGMIMVDANGKIVFANKAAALLVGYQLEELLGNTVDILIPQEHRQDHPDKMKGFGGSVVPRRMGHGRDLCIQHRDGRNIPAEITLTPLGSASDGLVMSTIVDLSERIAAQAEVAHKNDELAALNLELSHFAYSASHDLKAPLSSIAGLLGFCIEDLDEGNINEVYENLAKVVEISKRSAKKVEGVLKIAQAGREALPCEPIDLETIIQEIWLDLASSHPEITLELDLHKDLTLITERPTLGVVLENILSNALRYGDSAKPTHVVSVQSAPTEEGAQVSITDNGIGIPAKNLPQVFQIFKKLDERSGDGLGMALVKKQIDRLGGNITVDSTRGHGTTFSFTLPSAGDMCEQDTSDNC